jgi:small conductance mechanosensitive channel
MWREVITAQPEVWGVQEVTADSVLVRVIARTAPLRQWEVGRELRERLKVAVAGLTAEVAAAASLSTAGTGTGTGPGTVPAPRAEPGAGAEPGPASEPGPGRGAGA